MCCPQARDKPENKQRLPALFLRKGSGCVGQLGGCRLRRGCSLRSRLRHRLTQLVGHESTAVLVHTLFIRERGFAHQLANAAQSTHHLTGFCDKDGVN